MHGVQRVAILLIGTKMAIDNDRGDAEALQGRLLAKRLQQATSGLAAKTKATGGDVSVFELQKADDKTFKSPASVQKQLHTFLDGAESYGVYVIMHGTTDGYPVPPKAVLAPASVGAFLRKVVEMHGKADAFRKLNLVACNLGMNPDKPSNDGLHLAGPYAAAVCEALANPSTMVAGYTVPVYVYYTDNSELADTFGSKAPRIVGAPEKGQRLFAGGTALVVATRAAADNKGTVKRIWQYREGKAQPTTPTAYHEYS